MVLREGLIGGLGEGGLRFYDMMLMTTAFFWYDCGFVFRGKRCGILNDSCVLVGYGMVGLMILHVSRWWIYLFASGG